MPKRKSKGNSKNKSKKPYGTEWITENKNFTFYYQLQNIMPNSEFNDFLECLKKELPITFRLNTACPFYETLKQRLKTEFQYSDTPLLLDEMVVQPPFPIQWYPQECAWQINCPKRKLRKVPQLARFHKWLVGESEIGTLTRQEAVSMIPPLMLQVEDTDKILDMCAAPGSKTSQLLESLYKNTPDPSGMVIANDADAKRAYLLVRQTRRVGTSSLCITTHTAQNFPSLITQKITSGSSPSVPSSGIFDRILCDVPCSGDGTLRKAPEIWTKWGVGFGINLHPLQLLILSRGCALLKIGGRIVYSTCSLNPIEDESVIYGLLKRCKGSMKLVNMDGYLPDLKRRPGLMTWKVVNNKMEIIENYESVPNRDLHKFRPTMFPPTDEESVNYPLTYCMRFLPHDQDTGGFFVAVLEKVGDLPSSSEMKAILPETIPEPIDNSKPYKLLCHFYSKTGECKYGDKCRFLHEIETEPTPEDGCEEIIVPETITEPAPQVDSEEILLPETSEPTPKVDSEDMESKVKEEIDETRPIMQVELERLKPIDTKYISEIKDFYGIDDSFDFSLLYCRSDEMKTITYVSSTIRENCLDSIGASKLKIVTTGMRLFEKNKRGVCPYRLCQDALSVIRPHISKRFYTINLEDFKLLLQNRLDTPRLDTLSEETQNTFKDVEQGSVVYELKDEDINQISEGDPIMKNLFKTLCVAGWRGKEKMSALLSEYDANSYLARLSKGYVDYDTKTPLETE